MLGIQELRAEKVGLRGGGEAFSFHADQVPSYDDYRALRNTLVNPDNVPRQRERRLELLKEKVLTQLPSILTHPPRLLGRFNIPKGLWHFFPGNTIVTVGREQIGDNIIEASTDGWDYSAVGSDDGSSLALAVGNTALGTERARIATASSGARFRSATDVYFDGFYDDGSAANGQTIKEAGIFDAASSGTLLARGFVSPTIAKTTSNTATISHKLEW